MMLHTPWAESAELSIEQRHDRLHRTAYAMWTLLKSRLDLSDAELAAELARIDAAVSGPPPQLLDCSVCRRPVRSTARRCLYCGTSPTVELRTIDLTRISFIRQ